MTSPAVRGPVGWGDAVAAAAALGLGTSAALGDPTLRRTLEQLVALVGLVPPPPRTRQAWTGGSELVQPPSPPDPQVEVRRTTPITPSAPQDPVVLAPARDRRTDATALRDEPVDLGGIRTADPLPESVPRPDAVPYEPVVPGHQLRPALVALVRRYRPGSRVDVPRLVAQLVEQRPVRRLPTLPEPTTAEGVTVVADVGSGMLVHLQDVERLVSELQQAVGEPRVEVRWLGDPDRLPPLPPARPVIVVSDLGTTAVRGRPGAADRWTPLLTGAERPADLTMLVPHRRTARRLRERGVHALAWDDLPLAGRHRG